MGAFPVIHSQDNPVFKKLMALHESRGIGKYGEYLVGGPKVIAEIIQTRPRDVTAWITPASESPAPPPGLQAHRVRLSAERFRDVNVIGTPPPLLTLAVPALPAFDPLQPWPNGCTFLIPFGDPENIGAVIRVAVGLGAGRIVLLSEAANPFLPKAVRAAAGTLLHARIELGPSIHALASITTAPLFALDVSGRPLDTIQAPARFGLIVGQEGQGIPAAVLTRSTPMSIPLAVGVESLNAATSAAVALWALRPRRHHAHTSPRCGADFLDHGVPSPRSDRGIS